MRKEYSALFELTWVQMGKMLCSCNLSFVQETQEAKPVIDIFRSIMQNIINFASLKLKMKIVRTGWQKMEGTAEKRRPA